MSIENILDEMQRQVDAQRLGPDHPHVPVIVLFERFMNVSCARIEASNYDILQPYSNSRIIMEAAAVGTIAAICKAYGYEVKL